MEEMRESEIIISDERYLKLFEAAKSKVVSTRIRVARIASRSQFELYLWLGEQIVLAQNKYGWGKAVVERLSIDLKKTLREHLAFPLKIFGI